MKKVIVALTGLIVLTGNLFAQVTGAQIDSMVSKKIDSILSISKMTYNEVKYVDPLVNKTAGIEFNPAYLLLGSANKDVILSGTYSRFDIDRKGEIAIPLFFSNSRPFGLFEERHRTKVFTADVVYRRFLGAHQNGFYFSLGGRYAHLNGETEDSSAPLKSTDKFGVMTGIGYRYFAKSGFYWGMSVSAGRYLTGDMHMSSMDGGKMILDLELLKFGFTF